MTEEKLLQIFIACIYFKFTTVSVFQACGCAGAEVCEAVSLGVGGSRK